MGTENAHVPKLGCTENFSPKEEIAPPGFGRETAFSENEEIAELGNDLEDTVDESDADDCCGEDSEAEDLENPEGTPRNELEVGVSLDTFRDEKDLSSDSFSILPSGMSVNRSTSEYLEQGLFQGTKLFGGVTWGWRSHGLTQSQLNSQLLLVYFPSTRDQLSRSRISRRKVCIAAGPGGGWAKHLGRRFLNYCTYTFSFFLFWF